MVAEVRRFKASTVSRRMSVVAGFYRTCVIDGVLEHSPAEHVRRPNVPPESPTLGLTHLQFEALLCESRQSSNGNDFALVAMLGLLGLCIFEATGSNIEDLGEEHGHRVLQVRGKGGKVVLVLRPPAVDRAFERSVAQRTQEPILLKIEAPGLTVLRDQKTAESRKTKRRDRRAPQPLRSRCYSRGPSPGNPRLRDRSRRSRYATAPISKVPMRPERLDAEEVHKAVGKPPREEVRERLSRTRSENQAMFAASAPRSRSGAQTKSKPSG